MFAIHACLMVVPRSSCSSLLLLQDFPQDGGGAVDSRSGTVAFESL